MISVSEKMASFKIHLDDENDGVKARAKKFQEQKRTALSTLPGNELDRFPRDRNGVKNSLARMVEEKLLISDEPIPLTSSFKTQLWNAARAMMFPLLFPLRTILFQGVKLRRPRIPQQTGHIVKEASQLSLKPSLASTSSSENENLVPKPVQGGNNKKVEVKVAASPARPALKDLSNRTEPQVINEEENAPSQAVVKPLDNSPMVIDLPSSSTKPVDKHFYTACGSYFEDIYTYLRKLETTNGPKPCYMKRQPDVTYPMRSILVDWLVEVAEEFKLHSETMFLAVSLIDRFLSAMAVTRSRLQLLGTSALMIAAKFEEIYPPEVGEFAYITDDTYTKKQVLRMEVLVLETLSFSLSRPTPYTFLSMLSPKLNISQKTMFLAMYISELTLLEGDPYLEFNPSLIACASIALSRYCLYLDDVWPSSMERVTKYSFERFSCVMKHLNETHKKSFDGTLSAMKDKYGSNKYLNVSFIESRPLIMRESA